MSLEKKSALKATDGATPLRPLLQLNCIPPHPAHPRCPLSIIWSSEVAAFQKKTSYSFSSVPFYEYLQIHVCSPVPLLTPALHTACLNHLIFWGPANNFCISADSSCSTSLFLSYWRCFLTLKRLALAFQMLLVRSGRQSFMSKVVLLCLLFLYLCMRFPLCFLICVTASEQVQFFQQAKKKSISCSCCAVVPA